MRLRTQSILVRCIVVLLGKQHVTNAECMQLLGNVLPLPQGWQDDRLELLTNRIGRLGYHAPEFWVIAAYDGCRKKGMGRIGNDALVGKTVAHVQVPGQR